MQNEKKLHPILSSLIIVIQRNNSLFKNQFFQTIGAEAIAAKTLAGRRTRAGCETGRAERARERNKKKKKKKKETWCKNALCSLPPCPVNVVRAPHEYPSQGGNGEEKKKKKVENHHIPETGLLVCGVPQAGKFRLAPICLARRCQKVVLAPVGRWRKWVGKAKKKA